MHLRICCMIAFCLSVTAIRVPVDGTDDQPPAQVGEEASDPGSQEPTIYTSNEDQVDTYLFPPDPHKPENSDANDGQGLVTHLTPPSVDQSSANIYSNQPESNDRGDQTDWLPIAKRPETNQEEPQVHDKTNVAKHNYVVVNNPIVVPPELIEKNENHDRKRFGNPILVPHHEVLLVKSPQRHNIHHVFKPEFPPVLPTNSLPGLPVPSRQLEPPAIGALDEYALAQPLKYGPVAEKVPNGMTTLPAGKIVFDPNLQKKVTLNFEHSSKLPQIALDLIPPKSQNYRLPTSLYPKKYSPFHPVPIPIGPFVEVPENQNIRPLGTLLTIGKKIVGKKYRGFSKDKPSKPFQPYASHNLPLPNESKIHSYKQAEEEKQSSLSNNDQAQDVVTEQNQEKSSPEPVTSETNVGHSRRNPHQTLVRPIAKTGAHAAAANAPNERTEFRMHGMKGPHSYQFGYDTGKGKNRQFRYEERDNDGHVRGHYGYMDKHGKLRVVNYDADPKLGFRAEAPTDAEQE